LSTNAILQTTSCDHTQQEHDKPGITMLATNICTIQATFFLKKDSRAAIYKQRPCESQQDNMAVTGQQPFLPRIHKQYAWNYLR
jgi:hypothetical protein